MRHSPSLLLLAALMAAGCGAATVKTGTSKDGGSDAGPSAIPTDAGSSDAGLIDAGTFDAGTFDAGTFDAGTLDAGTLDAGAFDAGEPGDAGPPSSSAPGITCTDTVANVYINPTGLPAMMPSNRGDVVRCAFDAALTVADVNTDLTGKGVVGITATTGSNTYLISYRTTRSNGVAGFGTARVFLPTTPYSTPLPVIVTAHGSDGLGATCAPSMDPTGFVEMSLSYGGMGFAVIQPDYAGLGNEGTQGYLDNYDQAYSVLDAARALRKLMAPGVFSNQVILSGYSQGGGAVLSSQSLASAYGADGDVIGIVVFAAEWQSRLNSFEYVDALNDPTGLTIVAGVTDPPVFVMRQYQYQMNQIGPTTGGDGFPTASASVLATAAQSQCLVELGGIVQAEPHLADLIDPTLNAGLVACISGNGTGTGCTGTGLAMYTYLTNNILTGDPTGAPIVYIQGLADTIMIPSQEAACNIQKLQADGVQPQVCTDAAAEHTTVIERNVAYALSWIEAKLAGTTPPACTSTGMPACTP